MTSDLNIDKADWGDGPWQHEPDRVGWIDPETGLRCQILRHEDYGHLNGYVAVPLGHPAYGRSYYRLDNGDIHGGLTFSYHHVDDGESLWWVGFDTNHWGDYAPGFVAYMRRLMGLGSERGGEYRDLDYVKAEVTRLAAYLAAWTGED